MSETGIECWAATSEDWKEIWLVVSAVVERGDTYIYAPDIEEGDARAAWMLDGSSRALANYVIGEARRLGFRAMQFNAVVATNTRALRLWESLGFGIVGTVPSAFRHSVEGLVPVHIMYRDL